MDPICELCLQPPSLLGGQGGGLPTPYCQHPAHWGGRLGMATLCPQADSEPCVCPPVCSRVSSAGWQAWSELCVMPGGEMCSLPVTLITSTPEGKGQGRAMGETS